MTRHICDSRDKDTHIGGWEHFSACDPVDQRRKPASGFTVSDGMLFTEVRNTTRISALATGSTHWKEGESVLIHRWWDVTYGFPGRSTGKESACTAGDLGSLPGLGRSPGEGNGYPHQYSGLQ